MKQARDKIGNETFEQFRKSFVANYKARNSDFTL